jgi:hypothetical protein
MKKKITQEEWFAAASANDLWGASYINPMLFVGFAGQNVNESCEARHRSFLAAQIGCEKAGL